MGPLSGTNKATWCVKLLPMTVSAYHVDCGCFCALLKTHCCCLSPCGGYGPPSAPHHPPHSHPTPIHSIRDITAVGKNYLKTQQCQLGNFTIVSLNGLMNSSCVSVCWFADKFYTALDYSVCRNYFTLSAGIYLEAIYILRAGTCLHTVCWYLP